MKFGLSISGVQRGEPGEEPTAWVRRLLNLVQLARDEGFDYLSVGQHYLTRPYPMMHAVPLLGRLISESDDMRLVATVIAPLHHPLEIAETFGTLDVLSGGRVTVTFALGYRDEEYEAFGVPRSHRVDRMVEMVDGVRGLWTDGVWTQTIGEGTIKEVTSAIRPLQQPHPPIWIAANADVAIMRAATWGLPWRINSHADYDTVARQVSLYRENLPSRSETPVLLPMGRELFCGSSREGAFREASPHLQLNYDRYADWGQDRALPGSVDFRIGFEQLAEGRFIVGDPDDCERRLRAYEAFGVDHMTLRMAWPGMASEVSNGSIRLFASDVMPRFR